LNELIDFCSSRDVGSADFDGKYFQEMCGRGLPSASQFNKLLFGYGVITGSDGGSEFILTRLDFTRLD